MKWILQKLKRKRDTKDTIADIPLINIIKEQQMSESFKQWLSQEEIFALATTCKSNFIHFYGKGKVNRNYEDTLFERLLNAIALGQPASVKKILKQYPTFLTRKGTITIKYTGLIVEDNAPLQLAWGAEDADMCDTLMPFFDRLKTGKQIAWQQINEFNATIMEEKPYNFTPLIDAITDNRNNLDQLRSYDRGAIDDQIDFNPEDIPDIKLVLERYRTDLMPRQIKYDKHFPMENFFKSIEVLQRYWLSWSTRQNAVFWSCVIAYLQSKFPPWYAQAIRHGLDHYINNTNPIKRNLILEDGSLFYTPLASGTRLGHHFGLYSSDNNTPLRRSAVPPLRVSWPGLAPHNLNVFRLRSKHLYQKNKRRLKKLAQELQKTSSSEITFVKTP